MEISISLTSDIINTTGGDINISGASLSLGNFNTSGSFVDSGNVNLSASGNISAGNIITSGNGYGTGNISVSSTNGAITLGNLDTSETPNLIDGEFFEFVRVVQAGTVNLNAVGDIITGNINSSANQSFASATGGEVQVITTAGNITTGTINSSVFKDVGSGDFTATSGAVNLNAAANITTDAINSSAIATNVDGTATVTAGNVSLETSNPFGSLIRFNTIASQATAEFDGTIQGGNVQVLTNGVIQGTGTLPGGDTIATGGIILGQAVIRSPLVVLFWGSQMLALHHQQEVRSQFNMMVVPVMHHLLSVMPL